MFNEKLGKGVLIVIIEVLKICYQFYSWYTIGKETGNSLWIGGICMKGEDYGLVQDSNNSCALALELPQFCAKPLKECVKGSSVVRLSILQFVKVNASRV